MRLNISDTNREPRRTRDSYRSNLMDVMPITMTSPGTRAQCCVLAPLTVAPVDDPKSNSSASDHIVVVQWWEAEPVVGYNAYVSSYT